MAYEDKDFKKCLFNPLKDKDISQKHILDGLWDRDVDEKVLARWDKENTERLVKYIIALYDPESPLLKEPSLDTRRTEAALIAGFKLDDAFLEDEIYTCKDEFAVHAIAKYLQLRKSREFAGLIADEQTYWEFIKRLLEPISRADKDKDMISALDIKTKLSAAKEEINARLTANWKKFFADDDDLMKQATNRNVFTPEAYAGVIR